MRNLLGLLFFFVLPMAHGASPCEPALASLDNDELALLPGQALGIKGTVQSRFAGPVDLRVWKHWQASWNVESRTPSIAFEVIRLFGEDQKPYVILRFRSTQPGLRATLQGTRLARAGEWQVEPQAIPPSEVLGRVIGEWTEFTFSAADAYLDEAGKNLLTRIEFSVSINGQPIYQYGLTPMFQRGPGSAYWNNVIEGYSAHGGHGSIKVSTLIDQGVGWDKWNGTTVQPTTDYLERNELGRGAFIGLHRHERNQETWSVESGAFVAMNGVAPRLGGNYEVTRQWSAAGEEQKTEEFKAVGGWLEFRFLRPGDLTVIVPNPEQPDTVYVHGIRALTDGVFYTNGRKN